jgi:hypothetical protein
MYHLNLYAPILEEMIKTKILFDCTSSSSSYFLGVTVKYTGKDNILRSTKMTNVGEHFFQIFQSGRKVVQTREWGLSLYFSNFFR